MLFANDALVNCVMATLLLSVAIIDFKHRIIPDVLNLLIAGCGLTVSVLVLKRSPIEVVTAAAASGLAFAAIAKIYESTRGHPGLGWGDVKFVSAITCWLGIAAIPWVVLLASLSGLAFVVLVQIFAGGTTQQTKIAFGPHLAFASGVVWWSGLKTDW